VAVHQVSDESDDDNGPLPGFERYRDFNDLPMDVDAEMNSNVSTSCMVRITLS
jgi:hypothetical protein